MTSPVNVPSRAGELATRKEFFGQHQRYAVAAVFTRFEAVQWFTWDAETPEAGTGFASAIRQAATKAEAVAGL